MWSIRGERFAVADGLPGRRARCWRPGPRRRSSSSAGPDADTAVAALTHAPELDDEALILALRSPAFYVGAMGSRNTQRKRRERLAAAGLSRDELERLSGPAGLDLGGSTAAEAALAILAEAVAAAPRALGGAADDLRAGDPRRRATVIGGWCSPPARAPGSAASPSSWPSWRDGRCWSGPSAPSATLRCWSEWWSCSARRRRGSARRWSLGVPRSSSAPTGMPGQSASLRFGLARLADADKVVVTLGDAPLMTSAVIERFARGGAGDAGGL